MKNRGLRYLMALAGLMLAVGLACGSSNQPAAAPTQQAQPTVSDSSGGTATSGGDTSSGSDANVSFTDQNNYFTIDLPGNWKHTTGTDTNLYSDKFTSPDGHGFIESVVYDDGTPFTGVQNGQGALYLLHHYYSSTGQEGDIRISDDSIQKDKSERLTWTSKGGGYSGVSFFEIRHGTTFLMFTIWWDNDFKDKYQKLLDDVVTSYKLP
jgi:hypothetical protein